MAPSLMHGAHLAAARVRGVAFAALGDSAKAAACLEQSHAGAAEQTFIMPQVRALQAMVECGIEGVDAAARLGAVLRQLDGSPEQIAELLQSRDGETTIDVHALLQ